MAAQTAPGPGRRAGLALPPAAALALAVLAALAGGGDAAEAGEAGSADGARAAEGRPNVVVVMTDDQTVAQLSARTMPATTRLLGRRGVSFRNSIVTSPLCCPSRAAYLSGQYAHNNGVYDNEPGYPGLNRKTSTVYSWLRAAGYRTGHVGRWLLNYHRAAAPGDPSTAGGFAPPPGIEHWFGYVGPTAAYYGATFSRNGTPVTLGPRKRDYTTRAISREARHFVRGARSDPRPFFLTVAHLAPHSSGQRGRGNCGRGGLPIPEPGTLRRFRNERLPKPPSFDELRIGDKPDWIRSRPRLNRNRIRELRWGWRCALATLTSVDRGVASLVRELDRSGELGRTAIFFTSDNGYLFGEHRVFLNKVYPYEESIRVPLLARLPGPARNPRRTRTIGVPVSNLDLTATILALARAAPCAPDGGCRTLDGRSLLPLLRGRRPPWSRGRALLIELGAVRECGTVPDGPEGLNTFYDALRTKRRLYVELDRLNRETGACDRPEFELYDLRRDPYQLRNRAVHPAARSPRPRQAALGRRLAVLRRCAGIAGRDPAGPRPFCE